LFYDCFLRLVCIYTIDFKKNLLYVDLERFSYKRKLSFFKIKTKEKKEEGLSKP
jgi:hypothetical protein